MSTDNSDTNTNTNTNTNTDTDTQYQVLARKYRPRNFDDLIGQDALVRTLTNAIESGRIAHAFMLTGIRGVGKTTTARIIAKALNYTGADGQSGPTTGNTDDCEIARAIAEDRHPDVLEMDAASRTGVEDIREILDGVRYAPVQARYKIYIIDEVHMLSKHAFNALLKTLEEPPPHVKFIFATTEARKVPVTVISRCQRFDLRRVDTATLIAHYRSICQQENVAGEDGALSMIARAADGSVRDGLSLLDQAIALSGEVTQSLIRDMLGLSDRYRVMDLIDHSLKGEIQAALEILDELHAKGGDPAVLMHDLLDFMHVLARLHVLPDDAGGSMAMSEDERDRAAKMAAGLTMPHINRAWQILLKGVEEVQQAPHPQAAAEMVIVRLAYAANLPDPGKLVRDLQEGDSQQTGVTGGSAASASQTTGAGAPAPEQSPEPALSNTPPTQVSVHQNGGEQQPTQAAQQLETRAEPQGVANANLETLQDMVTLLRENGHMLLASQVYSKVRMETLTPGRLEFVPVEGASPNLASDLKRTLSELTGRTWMVTVANAEGGATLAESEDQARAELEQQVRADPLVAGVLEHFPGATIEHISEPGRSGDTGQNDK